jgi:cytoskeletal protein RodZ
MSSRPASVVAVLSLLAAAALLGGCDTGSSPAAAAEPSTTSHAVSPDPAPSTSPTGSSDATNPVDGTPTASASPTASATATAKTGAWPKALGEPQQGDPVWAVYLAVGHSVSDPALDAAQQGAASVGYQAVLGDLACDGGATQALGLDEYDYWSAAALYFGTQAQARTFASSYAVKVGQPRGVAKVSVGCLD